VIGSGDVEGLGADGEPEDGKNAGESITDYNLK